MKSNQIEAVFEGELAGFFPPSGKVERFSYGFMNPSAARGCLESILYKKEFRYIVEEIHVLKPIKFESVKVNEIKNKTSLTSPRIDPQASRTQRNQFLLRNPSYRVVASIALTKDGKEGVDTHGGKNTVAKYVAIFNRKLERGESFHIPCLGQRQFFADFRKPLDGDKPIEVDMIERNMLFDCFDLDLDKSHTTDYSNVKVTYFDAIMQGGVIKVPSWNEVKGVV